jgi:nucleoside-diphosphate-sugar epimerase
VKDVCKAVNLILTKGELNTIYNVGNNQPTVFRDAIQYVIDKTKSSSKIITNEQSGTQSKAMSMDSSKLQSLGYTPEYSIEMILDELIETT